VRNFKPLSIPIRLAAGTQRETQKLQEIALLGLMTGVLLTMSLMSLLRHLEHHNPLDRTAALYGLLAAASVAQINGGLNALLWQNLPTLADYASEVIPVMAMGCALLLVRKLYTLSTHYHRYDQVLEILGWCTLGSVLGYMLLDHATADQLGGLALALATAAGLLASLISWRSGAPIGGWLVLAYAPHFGVVLWHIGESMGWTPPHWEMRYGYSLTLACSVGLLSYALSRATHDRKEVELRADLLQTQDALTGLLTASIFQGHLESAYQRAIANREPIALVLVSVTNHERIRTTLGDTTAEQCLLRAVIKLHRILRDVDPAARVGSARFALLLEGVENRQTLTERLVKLVASGLIPLQGLQPEVTLQFQAACVLLHQNPVAPARVMNDLSDVLAGISPRTRRPIRFLDPTPTQAAPLAPLVKTA
jgi:diguanylate cyclase (GGDEF)-like protein